MANTKEAPKRKRGRPKKSEPVVTQVKPEPDIKLNQVWGASIYFSDGAFQIEAGRFTFHTPSKDMSVDPMFEDRKTAGWNNLVLALRGGVYAATDATTGAVTHYALDSMDYIAWIENIESAIWNFGGGNYTIRDLNKGYED